MTSPGSENILHCEEGEYNTDEEDNGTAVEQSDLTLSSFDEPCCHLAPGDKLLVTAPLPPTLELPSQANKPSDAQCLQSDDDLIANSASNGGAIASTLTPPEFESDKTSEDCAVTSVSESIEDDHVKGDNNIPNPPPLPPTLGSICISCNEDEPSAVGVADDEKEIDLDWLLELEGFSVSDLSDDIGDDTRTNSLRPFYPRESYTYPFKTGSVNFSGECVVCFTTCVLYRRVCCKNRVCTQCLRGYFTTMIRDGAISIRCPCCDDFVHRDEVFFFLESDMQVKFYKFIINANKEPHKKLCPQCSMITEMPLETVRDPLIKKYGLQVCCSTCSFLWCFPCDAPWHEGISCKQFRQGDKLVKSWARGEIQGSRNAQRCPSCKIFIERISGCDHMTCQHCSTEFCYLCGETFRSVKFIGNHYKKLSVLGCKYRYKPDKPGQRRLIRGTILGLKLLCVPVVTAAAFVAGAAVVSLGVVALPAWGAYKIHKRQKIKKSIKRRRALNEFLNAPCSCSICTTMHVDPYLDRWHHQRAELDNVSHDSSVWTPGEDGSSIWTLRKDIQVTAQVSPHVGPPEVRTCSTSSYQPLGLVEWTQMNIELMESLECNDAATVSEATKL